MHEQVAEPRFALLQARFALARLGHVRVGHDATAAGQGIVGHRHRAAVGPLALADEALAGTHQFLAMGDRRLGVVRSVFATLRQMAHDIVVRHAAHVAADLKPIGQVTVVGHDPEVTIEEEDALVDVLEDQFQVGRCPGSLDLVPAQLRQVMADADIAFEGAVGGKLRRAADHHRARGTGGIDDRGLEVAKGTTVLEIVEMSAPGRVVVVAARHIGAPLADQRGYRKAKHGLQAVRHEGEPQIGIHLPPPVGRNAGQKRKPVCSHAASPSRESMLPVRPTVDS